MDQLKARVIDLQNLILGQRNQTVTVDDDCGAEQPYVLITSSHDILKFDHKKSVALCVGIDKQFHSNYKDKSLKDIVVKDAEAMGIAFNLHLGLNFDQVKVHKSSTQPDDCTKKGIGCLFVESATQVQEGGIFIFYFAGHGILVKQDKCVLAPADFAGKQDITTGISGEDLVEWLHVAKCKADHVLVILDCCYAGDLGKILTSPGNMSKIKPALHVMCGSAASQESTSIDALGHAIFTYFFLRYLETHQCIGEFAIKQAMDDIAELCLSFSLLVMNHDEEKLLPGTMNPTLKQLDVSIDDVNIYVPANKSADETDSSKFELVIQLYRHDHPEPLPHPVVEKWLKLHTIQTAMETLKDKVPFSDHKELQEGIFSALLYSVASIQYVHDKTQLEERNLFLIMVVRILEAIGYVYPVNPTISNLIEGLEYYSQAAIFGEMNLKSLNDLYSEMIQIKNSTNADDDIVTANSNVGDGGGDEVDFCTVQANKEVPQQLRRLSSWEPLQLI